MERPFKLDKKAVRAPVGMALAQDDARRIEGEVALAEHNAIRRARRFPEHDNRARLSTTLGRQTVARQPPGIETRDQLLPVADTLKSGEVQVRMKRLETVKCLIHRR